MQQKLQKAVQDQKQKGEAEQRAAVSQLDLELRQARQQLVDARREANDSRLEIDHLKMYLFLLLSNVANSRCVLYSLFCCHCLIATCVSPSRALLHLSWQHCTWFLKTLFWTIKMA